jgi:predicted PurR-regulated permease PerM
MDVFTKPIRFLLFLSLLTVALYYGRDVIIPFCFAALLSMLFLPFNRRLERNGVHRGFASLISVLIFVMVVAGLVALLVWQMSDLSKDLSGIEQRVSQYVDQARQYISKTFGVSEDQQKKMMEKQQSSGGGQLSGVVTGIMSSMFSIMVNFILVLVYTFLLLFFRTHIRKFVLKLVRPEDQAKSRSAMDKGSLVAQKYLSGLAMMIACLWILYGIGFSIVGVKHAIFFAILCGVLEIVPFVGNITGTALTILATVAQGGQMNVVIGILIVYGLVQFFQTYILEPLVVGAEVNINPLSTILVIVIGETLWGVAGMVLAIPLLGITKIICDHVEPLQPYGFLIGQEKKKDDSKIKDKLLHLFSRKNKNAKGQ